MNRWFVMKKMEKDPDLAMQLKYFIEKGNGKLLPTLPIYSQILDQVKTMQNCFPHTTAVRGVALV